MEIIYGDRGSGKTTKLIQRIKEFGGVLVVFSNDMKKNLINQRILAEDQVLSFSEVRKMQGLGTKKYYIDGIEFLFEELFGSGCEGFSIDAPVITIECEFNLEKS